MDCIPLSSSVRGILQARILEWVAVSFRGSSPPRDQALLHCKQILYCLSHQSFKLTSMIPEPSDSQIITLCDFAEVGAETWGLRCWLEVLHKLQDPFIPDCPQLPPHQGLSHGQSEFSLRPPGIPVTIL